MKCAGQLATAAFLLKNNGYRSFKTHKAWTRLSKQEVLNHLSREQCNHRVLCALKKTLTNLQARHREPNKLKTENYLIKCLIRVAWVCSKCYGVVGKLNRELLQKISQINGPDAVKCH